MGTLAAVACGLSNNLIERAADVAIKEHHSLIIVPREMPLSVLHLENMLKLARLGVVVMPASPAFYHQPQSIQDVVDFVVERILKHLGLQGTLTAWGV
jgi:4-hydroxy-3-polyprenylbenzoate decarboxylase